MDVIVVNLGGDEFGLHVSRIVEVLGSRKICSVPHMPFSLAGVISLRGEIIPLVDLRKRFNIESVTKKEMIVVVRSGMNKFGLVVDGVKEVLGLSDNDLVHPPEILRGVKTGYLAGIARKGERLILVLDLDKLLTPDEISEIRNAVSTDLIDDSGGEGSYG